MYSVEDLLISHGYKVSSSNNVPPSHSPSSHHTTYDQRPPTRSNSRCEIVEKRAGHGTVNGYKTDCVYGGGGVRQTSSRGAPNDTEIRDRKQRTEEEDNGNLGNGQSPGDNLTTDSGFHESHRGTYTQSRLDRDVSYWRRRGQDFNALLDYADFKEPHGKESGISVKAEGMQRRPESALSTEEHRRERQRRVDSARARERELALYQWRIAAERKYQSLGTEEFRPAVGMGRQMSDSDGERWAQEQQHRPRTAEGAVPPRTKAKSQSLPRMTMPSDSVQFLSTSAHGQDPYGSYRINGHQLRETHGRNVSEGESRERWTDSGRLSVQSAPPSKPRFSRPLRPPSYEVHQQMRGSSEMLSGEFMSNARDRTPLPFSRQEYFAQEPGGSGMEPPGYIPPPSYRRQPTIRGGHRTYANSMGNYQYRGEPYMQAPAMTEVQEWFMRQTGMSWPDHHRDGKMSMPCRRQAYPAYSEERMGNVQYIPFDDPRVRHISGGGIDGNSLTDADKIRNIRKEIPNISLSEKAPDDSAFLFSEKTHSSTEASKSNISDCANEAAMHQEGAREISNSKSVSDENSNRYPAGHDYSERLSQQSCETITQVKQFEAQTAAENKKNKKKLKETMFCLVSVPINMIANKQSADPNNNENVPSPMVAPKENTVTQPYTQDSSTISVSNEPQVQSSSFSTIKSCKRAPLKKEIVDVWSLQANADKELCYAGSWPGDQYKNQETQTGSPEVSRSVHLLSPHTQGAYNPPSSDTTTDSGVGTECSTSSGHPLKGQKNLNLSSNSAFSRTRSGSSPSVPVKSSSQLIAAPPSPDRQPPVRRSTAKTQASDGQEVFGQFLLKPVNRRPWDAIGELESFNKEIQDQNSKLQPSVGQTIEDLDEALQNILEVSNTWTEVRQPGTTPQNLKRNIVKESYMDQSPEQPLKKGNLNIRSDFEIRDKSEVDREHREVRSAFSGPKGRTADSDIAQRQEMPIPKDSSLGSYEVLQGEPRGHRLDIPVPKESLLKDVGLTVYTAIPDTVTLGSPTDLSPESPMLTSPSDNSETCEALHITSSDSGGERSRNSPDFSPDQLSNSQTCITAKPELKKEQSRSKVTHTHVHRNQHFRFAANYSGDDDDDDDGYSDYLSWSNEKTLADEHLETLLCQEKANNMPTEDLSKLYQVQSAQGIPVHESIEQRAARILGIAVPAEALVVNQDDVQQNEGKADEAVFAMQHNEKDPNEVSRAHKEVVEKSVFSHGLKMEKKDADIRDHNGKDVLSAESHVVSAVLELPEFPPSNLRLSLLVTEDEELALSVSGGEKRAWTTEEVSVGGEDKSNGQLPFPMFSDEELSAECVSHAVEDEPESHISTFTKEMEEAKELGDKKSLQEEEVLEGDNEQVVEAAFDESKDEVRCRKSRDENEESEEKIVQESSKQQPKSMTHSVSQPRSGTVVKREITLPATFNMTTALATLEDDDVQSVSETYDPSRVERV